MKTKIVLFSLAFTVFFGMFSVSKLNAQVTIGGSTVPQRGAILDLNAAFTGGLLLPNVEITDLGKIPYTFSDVSVQGLDVVRELTGLIVYNTTASATASIYRGIYVWDGDNWQLLAIDGGMMSIPADTPGYDSNNPLVDGFSASTGAVQIINPGLDVIGQYSFVVIVGDEFATVMPIELSLGIFSVDFQSNPTAHPRRCVVLVTDPAGKTATFIFTQRGSDCVDDVTVTVDAYGSTALCQNGAVHAYIASVSSGNVTDHTYFWLRNGVQVAQGAGVELKQAGTYTVYANMIGCGTPGTITVTASDNMASRAPHIIVDNNGILCGTNGVTLSALNAPNSAIGLIWLKDGLEQARDVNSFYVPADEANQGVWYLIYTTGDDCSSISSNKINIVYTSGVSGLPMPDARINDISIDHGSLTICAGGTLELTIANASDYSSFSNVQYEWFGNGQSLGRTTASTMYVVPPTATNLVLSVTVTATGECPMSKTSNEFTVLQGSTPVATSINRGDAKAFICATQPAVLTAGATGSAYQWFRNGQELPTPTNPLSVMQPGIYTVRYANDAGCWSMVSTPIEVIQSAPVTLSWISMPADAEIFESSKTYSVVVAPDADVIEWIASDPSVAAITKLGNGNAAIVTYGNTPSDDFQIIVTATNACGTAELISSPITVGAGCIPAGSVVITPNSDQIMEQGKNITFTASANTGNAPISYKWFVDGIEQIGVGMDGTFVFTASARPTPYAIAARATAACAPTQEATSAPVQVIVTINPTLLPDAPADFQTAFFGSKSCLDVRATEGNAADNPWMDGGRLPLSIRPNDFNNGQRLAFTYNFRGSSAVSNVRFIMRDPQNLVQSVSGDANASQATAAVTFRPNAYTSAAGTTANTALQTILYAVFDAGGQTYKDSIVIRIQDQACGCPAKVSATTWQMFQCHNAGADVTNDPFDVPSTVIADLNTNVPSRDALRGAYYAWGRKQPARDRNRELTYPQPTTTMPNFGVGNWPVWENPCGYGWTVTTLATFRNLFAASTGNTITRPSTFLKIGDYLLLPGQAYYVGSATAFGAWVAVDGEYHYWTGSSTSPATYTADNIYVGGGANVTRVPVFEVVIHRNYLESVRCIQEGVPYQQGSGQW